MQDKDHYYGSNTHEIVTALRDIVDVLYDGQCQVLKDEELCLTVYKKIGELRNCPEKERQYKLFKILCILFSSNKAHHSDDPVNMDVVIPILDEMYRLCIELLRNKPS